jgi:hypothetical protein
MPTHEKKRQYSRADVSWPVFLLTPECIVKGETKNISLGGAFIHFLSDPVQDRFFRLLIKPPNYEGLLVVSAKVAWKSRRHESQRVLPSGMGVQFTQISSSTRDFLHSVFSPSM